MTTSCHDNVRSAGALGVFVYGSDCYGGWIVLLFSYVYIESIYRLLSIRWK